MEHCCLFLLLSCYSVRVTSSIFAPLGGFGKLWPYIIVRDARLIKYVSYPLVCLCVCAYV